MREEDGNRRGRSPSVVPCRADGGGAMQLHQPDCGSDLNRTAENEKRRGVENEGDGVAQGNTK